MSLAGWIRLDLMRDHRYSFVLHWLRRRTTALDEHSLFLQIRFVSRFRDSVYR